MAQSFTYYLQPDESPEGRLGINPRGYLLDVLTRLPALTNRQAADLTPRRWLAARRRAQAA